MFVHIVSVLVAGASKVLDVGFSPHLSVFTALSQMFQYC